MAKKKPRISTIRRGDVLYIVSLNQPKTNFFMRKFNVVDRARTYSKTEVAILHTSDAGMIFTMIVTKRPRRSENNGTDRAFFSKKKGTSLHVSHETCL